MNLLVEYAKSFLGINYLYGGSNALTGFDCSGLVQEIMKSVGMGSPIRMNARQLYTFYKTEGKPDVIAPGALVFYGKTEDFIDHIAFMVTEKISIEAGHGDQTTINKEIAAKRGAIVHLRPYEKHGPVFKVLMPNYPDWVKLS